MEYVFDFCTTCGQKLSEDEIQINRNKETFYYPTCNECLDEFDNKINGLIKNGK